MVRAVARVGARDRDRVVVLLVLRDDDRLEVVNDDQARVDAGRLFPRAAASRRRSRRRRGAAQSEQRRGERVGGGPGRRWAGVRLEHLVSVFGLGLGLGLGLGRGRGLGLVSGWHGEGCLGEGVLSVMGCLGLGLGLGLGIGLGLGL